VLALEVRPLVIDHIFAGEGNPDGIHYGWVAHEAIGKALAAALAPDLARPDTVDQEQNREPS
jgi:hypothetical protein